MQDDGRSKYASRGYTPPSNQKGTKTGKLPFARMDIDAIAAIGRMYSPETALIAEMQRLSGLRRYKQRDGWMPLTQEILERVGLLDEDRRYRVLRQVRADGVLEVRRLNTYGNKVEYRLNPAWAKPKAGVVDLAAVRKARKRAR